MKQKKDKIYPEDYTKEQQEMIKELVIARLKQIPDNFRIAIG